MTRTASRAVGTGSSGGRRARRWIIIVAIVVALLAALDFAARAAAERVLASKIQQQGLQHTPSVSIGGFPFLTQVASRNFQQVNITDADQTAGPVTITKITATAAAIHINSFAFSSGTIGSLNGTALISFASLGDTLAHEFGALGDILKGAGLYLTPAGPDEVRASLNLLVTSGSATWRVSRLSGDRIHIHLVSSNGLPSSLLGSIQDLTLQIPKLPLGLTIDSIQVTQAGVVGRVSAHNVPFGS